MKRGTPDHPKVHDLAERLGISWLHAVGLLEMLWHTTARYAPQGNIGKWPDKIIAEHFREPRWVRNPEKLISSLVECGWLDRDPDYRLIVHDWDQHADQSVRKTLKFNGVDFIKPASNPVVYFVRAGQSKLIKIGVTGRRNGERFAELQRNSLEPLETIAEVPGGFALEDQLHQRFAGDWVRGEWFKESNELLSVINQLVASVPEMIRHGGGNGTPHLALPEPKPKPEPGKELPPKPPVPGGVALPQQPASGNSSVPTVRQIRNVRTSTPELFDEIPTDLAGTVRPNVPAAKTSRRRGHRTTEEIKAALGPERLPWWEAFWGAYPCHEGMNPCLDTFERKVRDRDLAMEVYRGAKAYAAKITEKRKTEPDCPVKYGQGWINEERWRDEVIVVPARAAKAEKPSIEETAELLKEFRR